jgi:anti-anti-sigma factor
MSRLLTVGSSPAPIVLQVYDDAATDAAYTEVSMELSPRRFDDAVVVSPAGRIDQSTVDGFQAALAPHLQQCADGKDRLILDLSRLEYISSAGLRVLMLAARQCKAQKGTLLVAGPQPLVREIFQITKFTMVLTIVPSVDDALTKAA